MIATLPTTPMFSEDERAPALRAAIYDAIVHVCQGEAMVTGPMSPDVFLEAAMGAVAALAGQHADCLPEQLPLAVVDLGDLFTTQLRAEIHAALTRERAA